ncbi:siderophore ABC transporter substrate-binding protein [Sanguibacter suaedae]|uniref:ABC transporter substrate-binding protein n=1 Tax=Sanguibacter suaedae TaxID=2795737 RepID=A0A934I7K0_9MICO|nr:ABC transporter substrate-binding protein [Sanguibacter suaedae]MBI9115681.1 ABC transporter substrate-binding protein [Sanguibacter suaedae]
MRVQSGRRSGALVLLTTATLALAACSADADATSDGATGASDPAAGTVEIEDNHGTVEVPVNPERVVALDNHVFETLSAWDVDLEAAPKPIMGDLWPEYLEDSVLDVGSHREPNLEAIIEAQPDLVIGGYRFSDSYEDIKAQNPDATVIEIAPREGEDASDELVRQIEILGKVFDREDDAAALVEAFDAAVTSASDAYDDSETVVGLITSGGEIAYSAPVTGRSIGMLFPTLGLTPAIEQEAEDVSHGDDISVEAIAAANPDWIIVLDRDGAVSEEGGYSPAAELISGSEALSSVTAVVEDQVIYLDPSFYLTEDIQAYTALYEQIAQAFAQAS